MYSVVTTRFNNETLEANYAYRQKRGYTCLYCSPLELSHKIYYDTPVFVIEMNNSKNKVEGIGLIKNSPFTDKYCKVHEDGNINRYIYIGNYFIERSKIVELNNSLLLILDDCLFKGRTHSKRGSGLSLFPEKLLSTEICQGMNVKLEIKNMFLQYFREKEIINHIL
jgi:hypothetical protein